MTAALYCSGKLPWHVFQDVGGLVGLDIMPDACRPLFCGFVWCSGPLCCQPELLRPIPLMTGPSRALFLPGGLLAPNDVPVYLNGSLAGE